MGSEMCIRDRIITDLKNATAEMARHLIIKDRTVEQASRELKNLQADVVKLEFNPTYRAPVIPPSVWEIIKFYGTLRTTPGQARLVRA